MVFAASNVWNYILRKSTCYIVIIQTYFSKWENSNWNDLALFCNFGYLDYYLRHYSYDILSSIFDIYYLYPVSIYLLLYCFSYILFFFFFSFLLSGTLTSSILFSFFLFLFCLFVFCFITYKLDWLRNYLLHVSCS